MPGTAEPANAAAEPSGYLYSVNCWCLPNNDSIQDIAQSARTGAKAVGLWEGKFRNGEDQAIAEALQAHGVRAGIVMPHHWTILPTPLDPEGYVDWHTKCDAICESIARLAPLNPVSIMVGPGVSGDPDHRLGPVEDVAAGLAQVADTAAEYGLRIAFEPLALRRGAAVATLPETIELLDTVGRDNVEILLDVWHSWPEPDLHVNIQRYAHRFIGVQINDVRDPERSWCDRVLPGAGRNVCTPIVASLIEAGFKGWYDFEVFSDDGRWGNAFEDSLWKLPHEEFLRRGHAAFDRCFAEASRTAALGGTGRA